MYCTLLCHLLSATEIFPDVKKNEQNLDKKLLLEVLMNATERQKLKLATSVKGNKNVFINTLIAK